MRDSKTEVVSTDLIQVVRIKQFVHYIPIEFTPNYFSVASL